jgi:hypothetical protein
MIHHRLFARRPGRRLMVISYKEGVGSSPTVPSTWRYVATGLSGCAGSSPAGGCKLTVTQVRHIDRHANMGM